MNRLQNRVVVVTGGAQGIGEAIALRAAQEGAQVVLWDLRDEAIEAATARIGGAVPGARVSGRAVDVADGNAVRDAAAAVIDAHGRIDGLVNNAGIVADAQLKKMSDAQFDRVIAINLKGVYNGVRAFAERFLEQGAGSIVSISSVVGLYGNFGQTNYAAAKAGVIAMTKTWAREFARSGFTVNAVAPGFISTKMTEAMPAEVLAGMAAKVPLQRLGKTSDIAQACMFLSSDGAGYVSGTVISVDGALTL